MPRADATLLHSTHVYDTSSECGIPPREPELEFVDRVTVVSLTDAFTPQQWHRPFAEALLTGDSTRIQEAIVCAQRAILNRYLELASGWESKPDEARDLANAVDVLQTLKRTADRVPIHATLHHSI